MKRRLRVGVSVDTGPGAAVGGAGRQLPLRVEKGSDVQRLRRAGWFWQATREGQPRVTKWANKEKH